MEVNDRHCSKGRIGCGAASIVGMRFQAIELLVKWQRPARHGLDTLAARNLCWRTPREVNSDGADSFARR
jgi:hypothetical protein